MPSQRVTWPSLHTASFRFTCLTAAHSKLLTVQSCCTILLLLPRVGCRLVFVLLFILWRPPHFKPRVLAMHLQQTDCGFLLRLTRHAAHLEACPLPLAQQPQLIPSTSLAYHIAGAHHLQAGP